jgi:hypothetical protein
MNSVMSVSATSIDSRIIKYLGVLNEQQKKAVLLVAETFAREVAEPAVEYNNAFVSELDRRASELESGAVKGYSWDEVRKRSKLKR